MPEFYERFGSRRVQKAKFFTSAPDSVSFEDDFVMFHPGEPEWDVHRVDLRTSGW